MTGRFICVVGPSGVGKDTVMTELCKAEPRLHLVRRVITRPATAGGEDFDGVSEEAFEQIASKDGFCLHWRAHGLRYGIPMSVKDRLADGEDMLANLSRAQLLEAQECFERTSVILLTARPEVLKERLIARNRESADDITRRLARADFELPEGITPIEIDNSGDLPGTIARARAALFPDDETAP